MKISELIHQTQKPVFSFELLPPLRGNSIKQIFDTIDRLKEFGPKYINITTHHSENIYRDDFYIDLSNPGSHSTEKLDYPKGTSVERILNDVDHYYLTDQHIQRYFLDYFRLSFGYEYLSR